MWYELDRYERVALLVFLAITLIAACIWAVDRWWVQRHTPFITPPPQPVSLPSQGGAAADRSATGQERLLARPSVTPAPP